MVTMRSHAKDTADHEGRHKGDVGAKKNRQNIQDLKDACRRV